MLKPSWKWNSIMCKSSRVGRLMRDKKRDVWQNEYNFEERKGESVPPYIQQLKNKVSGTF